MRTSAKLISIAVAGILGTKIADAQSIIPKIPLCAVMINVPCVVGEFVPTATPLLSTILYQPPTVLPPLGNSVSEIEQNFPNIMAYNFGANPALDNMLTNMAPQEMAILSTELQDKDHTGMTYWMLAYAAQKASAQNLQRLTSVFGPQVMAQALPYAPAATYNAYLALPPLPPEPNSVYWYASRGQPVQHQPSSSYAYDVFLDTYTASVNEVKLASVAKAVTYLQARIKFGPADVISFVKNGGAGVATILGIISFFDPNAWDDVLFDMNMGSQAGFPYGFNAWLPQVISLPDITYDWPTADPGELPDLPPIEIPTDYYNVCVVGDAC